MKVCFRSMCAVNSGIPDIVFDGVSMVSLGCNHNIPIFVVQFAEHYPNKYISGLEYFIVSNEEE